MRSIGDFIGSIQGQIFKSNYKLKLLLVIQATTNTKFKNEKISEYNKIVNSHHEKQKI